MRVGVPNQGSAGEPRVALVPDVVRRLGQRQIEVVVESGAGAGSHIPDDAFSEAGATIGSAADAWGAEVVTGYAVRAAVREQVESLGARFLELDVEADAEGEGGYAKELAEEQQRRQRQAMAEAIGRFDAVIATALVPGRRAPILVTEAAVEKMKPGSVVVDLAASAGGNCELTEPGQTVERHGVKIVGVLDLAAEMPDHASQLYARNVQSLLELMVTKEGKLELNWEDEIVAGACITRDGEIVHEGAKQAAGAPAA